MEVILYSAVEAAQKYYIIEEGGDVTIETEIYVVPTATPAAAYKITWVKVPNKELSEDKYVVSDDKTSPSRGDSCPTTNSDSCPNPKRGFSDNSYVGSYHTIFLKLYINCDG